MLVADANFAALLLASPESDALDLVLCALSNINHVKCLRRLSPFCIGEV